MSTRNDLDKEGQRRLKVARRKVAELKATRQHWGNARLFSTSLIGAS